MTYVIARALLIGFAGLVTGGAALWFASRPSRLASRLGMRGLKRQRALLEPFWAAIEPFVRWTGVRVSGALSDKSWKKFDLSLTHAGDFLGLTPAEYFGLLILAAFIGGVGGGVATFFDTRLAPGIAVMAIAGAAIPHVIVDNARAQRFRAINRGLPNAIDLMALSMSAGLDFPGSLQQVVAKAKANEALRDEFDYMLQQFQLGRTRAQVLKELAERVPIDSVREFVHALVQAEERGTPVADALEIQASTARIRRSHLAEAAASDMAAKLVLPLMMMTGVELTLIAVPSSMMVDNLTSIMTSGSQK